MPEIQMRETDGDSANAPVEFDDVFKEVNSFGIYQQVAYFGCSLLIVMMASWFGFLVFGFATPTFRCSTPNSTCPINTCCDNCTSHTFDKPFTSTVTEWNLVCDRASFNAVIQSCMYAGMLFGCFTSGIVSDTLGRKKCIFIFNGIMLISGFASSFSNGFPLMAALWFVLGFGVLGLDLCQYIYILELVGPKARTMAGVVNSMCWTTSHLVLALLAYLIRDWRILCIVISTPGVLLYIFWWRFPESPRWLVAHDQLQEAKSVLLKYGGKKNKPIDEERLMNLLIKVRQTQIEKEKKMKISDPRMLCQTPKLRKWSAALGFNWFATSFLSNALFLYINNLSGNIYLNYTIMTLISLFQQPIMWIILKNFGRRIPHATVMFLVATQCLLVLVLPDKYPTAKSMLFLGAGGINFCLWTTIYLTTSELYPTVIRNTAQGTGATIGRISTIGAPFVAILGRSEGLEMVPIILFIAVSVTAGVVSLFVPETLFAPLYQTIEDVEEATPDYGIPCCGRPGNKPNKVLSGIQQPPMEDTKL